MRLTFQQLSLRLVLLLLLRRGERMIISTLQECPQGDPLRMGYNVLVHSPKVELRPTERCA